MSESTLKFCPRKRGPVPCPRTKGNTMSDKKNAAGKTNGVQNPPARATRVRPSGRGVAERVRGIIEPVAEELGYYLWNVEYVKEGADYILRVTIDNDEGITIDDCERMTRAIDPVLDEHDPIEDSYLLEVSSPGIERELTRDDHFALCVGEKVEVRLFAPVDGSRIWVGILGELDEEGNVPVTTADTTRTFPRAAIAKIRTMFEF